jgi:outer membrane lipase/esterase
MRLRLPSRVLAAVVAVTLAVPAPAAAQLPTSLTFLGDSFTDTGNGDIIAGLVLGTDLTPSPPYAPGRASNGLLWADYLAAAFGRVPDANPSLLGGRNFAVGTARTGFGTVGPFAINMRSQLATVPPPLVDPTGLYAIFGGANDVGDALSAVNPFLSVATAAGNIATIVSDLYGLGARSFLVPNLPNVGLAPGVVGTPASAPLGALTDAFNAALAANLAGLSALPGIQIYGLDLHQLFENILLDAAQGGPRYGLTNTTLPCFAVPIPCATSVFVDQEHPTTAAHQLIAQAAFQRVAFGQDVRAIPEPSTIALVAGGLLVLGGIARRRRAA